MVSFRAERPVPIRTCFAAVLLLTALHNLSGCGNAGAYKAQAPVAAVVNGEEITMRRLDGAALGAPVSPDAEHDRLRALEDAIDQELLVQRALQTRLDRDPGVAHEIERATRRILAQAYLRQAIPTVPAGTPEEVGAFYRTHPALFAERRVYWLQELQARMTREQIAALEARVATARKLKDIARWLQSQRIPFDVVVATRAAEQLPLDMLNHISGMKDGELAVFASPDGVSVVERVQSQAAPLAEEDAAPLIRRYLESGKRVQRAAAEIGKLRQQARIKYAAEFDRMRLRTPVAAAAPHARQALSAHPSPENGVSGL